MNWRTICGWTTLAFLVALVAACSGNARLTPPDPHERAAEARRLRQGLPKLKHVENGNSQGSELAEADPTPEDPAPTSTEVAEHKTGDQHDQDDKQKYEGFHAEVIPPELSPVTELLTPMPPEADTADLVLGEFQLKDKKPIIDGDTVKVEGLDASLRLLAIDTEETFKKKKEKELFKSMSFADYAAHIRGDSPFPAKFATPAGEEAREYAEDFFAGHSTVRLEFDELSRQRGVYGRYLVYVFVKKDGEWVNYNVECVRAGWSPYFMKYGYSRRFHEEFVEAQEYAQANKLGIWGDGVDHYFDYDERLEWWKRRANALVSFENEYMGSPDVIQLGLDSEWDKMANLLGTEVTVFGTLGDLKLEKSPYLMRMSHKRGSDFTIVAFDWDDVEALGIERFKGEYFYARGKLSEYKGKYQFKTSNLKKVWTE